MYPVAMTWDLNQSLMLLQNLAFPPEPVIRVIKPSREKDDGGSSWAYIILMLASFSSTYGRDGYSGTGFDKFGLACGINTAYGINTASVNRDFT